MFVRKKKALGSSKKTMKTVLATNSEYLRGSFVVAYKTAKTGKSYNIAEELSLPAANNNEMIVVYWETHFRNCWIKYHFQMIQLHIAFTTWYTMLKINWHYQSTVVSGISNLLGFVRYVH